MYVKKVKHVCDVRGCKNTASFLVSRTREMGGSILLCAECAEQISAAILSYTPPTKTEISEAPKLFYGTAGEKNAADNVDTNTETDTEAAAETTEAETEDTETAKTVKVTKATKTAKATKATK